MANFVIFRFLKKTKLSPCLLDMTEKKGMAGPGLDVVILSKASLPARAASLWLCNEWWRKRGEACNEFPTAGTSPAAAD